MEWKSCPAAALIISTLLTVTVKADPPSHLNSGGLCDLATDFRGAPDRWINGVLPAGDVDGDGRDDLVFRDIPLQRGALPDDRVVLLYGQPFPGPVFDLYAPGIRRTVITTGEWSSGYHWDRFYAVKRFVGLAAGQDVNGDASPDLLLTSGHDPRTGGPAMLLLYGNPRGGALPESIEGSRIGTDLPGAVITEAQPAHDWIVGEITALCPDLNGDGLGEVAVIHAGQPGDRSTCSIIYGSRSLPTRMDLSEVGISLPGFRVEATRQPGDLSFRAVTRLGDVDGDGFSELGLVIKDETSNLYSSSILFGRDSFPQVVFLDDLPQGWGVQLPGYIQLARGGDVDGDGFEEVNGVVSNTAAVLHGQPRPPAPVNLTDFFEHRSRMPVFSDGAEGCLGLGGSFAPAEGKDLDGDGLAEVLFAVGCRSVSYAAATQCSSGRSFLLWGTPFLPEIISSDRACPPPDFRCQDFPDGVARAGLGAFIDGAGREDCQGRDAYLLEDFDGDRRGDLLFTRNEVWGGGDPGGVRLISGEALAGGIRPRLGSMDPAAGPVSGGNSVMLFGAGFDESAQVEFGGVRAQVEELVGSGVLVVKVPAGGIAGKAPVTLTTLAGKASGCAPEYTYLPDFGGITVEGGGARTLTVRHRDSLDFRTLGMAVGDFDGDRRPDLALLDRPEGAAAGVPSLRVVLGRKETGGGEILLEDPARVFTATLSADDGVTEVFLDGLASGGDLNADGLDDLLLEVTLSPGTLPSWLFLPGRTEFPLDVPFRLSDLDRIRLTAPDRYAGPAAILPDLDGDGIDDLLVSTMLLVGADLYLMKGRRDLPPAIDLDQLAALGRGAHLILGILMDEGIAGPAGDFDGDGFADFYFGGSGYAGEGAVAVLYGGPSLFFSPEAVVPDGSFFGDVRGLLLTGGDPANSRDLRAVFPGDLDGDGRQDLFFRLDNSLACEPTPCAGRGFMLDRPAILRQGFTSPLIAQPYREKQGWLPDYSAPAGREPAHAGALEVESRVRGEGLGGAAAAAGDFNGDGLPDLLLGNRPVARQEETSNTCYVVFGAPDLRAVSPLDPGAPGERALAIRGGGFLRFGTFVAGGFDWDGDGADDIAIGSAEGRADIVFGSVLKEVSFIRGDANRDGAVDISDAVATLNHLFLGTFAASCRDALDADDGGTLDITDAIALLQFQFLAGTPPPPPFPAAGTDPTPDGLRCRG